jgi:ribosomal protein L11 methyltransferase
MSTTAWHKLIIPASNAQVEAIEALCWQHGAAAVSLLDGADQALLEPGPGELPLWSEVMVEALLPRQSTDDGSDNDGLENCLMALLAAELIDDLAAVSIRTLADQPWERAWMDAFQPMRFGERLWVCPWHCTPYPAWPAVLRLDPGLAFGSGTHATTDLCLQWLDGAELSGKVVLDFGCGSGVLALAAGLLGAAELIAVDHDPQALVATRDNAQRNQLTTPLSVLTPAEFEATTTQADLILANILAAPLISLAPQLINRLRPAGQLVLSGLLAEQAEAVTAAYRQDLGEPSYAEHQGWVRLAFRRPDISQGQSS